MFYACILPFPMVNHSRHARRGFVSVFLGWAMFSCFIFVSSPGIAEGCTTDPLPCIVRVLGEQKTNGEELARLLHAYARGDISKEANGIRLYAAARAAFDGVIEELKLNIDGSHSPGPAAELNEAVHVAVKRSQEFAVFVDEVLPKDGAARSPFDIAGILKGAGELIKSVVESGLAIWDKFHERGNEENNRIRNQLDQLKWKSFAEAIA